MHMKEMKIKSQNKRADRLKRKTDRKESLLFTKIMHFSTKLEPL